MSYDFTRMESLDVTTGGFFQAEPKCSPYIVRFLVENGPETFPTDQKALAFPFMSEGLKEDFSAFKVLGTTVALIKPGEQVSGTTAGKGTYVVDVVFAVRASEWVWTSPDKVANSAAEALVNHGLFQASVRVLSYATASSCATTFSTPAWVQPIGDFWNNRPAMFEWSNNALKPTDVYTAGALTGVFGPDGKSYSQGFADFPESLSPIPFGKVVGPDGKTPVPGTPGGPTPAQTDAAQNWLVAGIFAFIGWATYRSLFQGKKV